MAHGFRDIPKDRQHAPEFYPPFRSPFELFYQAMPVPKFIPFDIQEETDGPREYHLKLAK